MKKLIAIIIVNVLAVLLGIMAVGSVIAFENEAAISSYLGANTQRKVPLEEGGEEGTEYYKSDYANLGELIPAAQKICEEAEAEGAVLLKNENKALPLTAGNRKVSLFGITSVDPVFGGTGSGSADTSTAVMFDSALVKSGFTINQPLYNWYSSNKNTYKRVNSGSIGATSTINDAAWSNLPADKANSSYGDAAIFVIGRVGGEGADMNRTPVNNDTTNGNYLALSPKELTVLSGLKEEKDKGTFKRIVVLINSANQVEADFMDNAAYGVDAALWIGSVGQTGLNAVAEILAGTVNPSGRLSDAFWAKHYLNPVHANFGVYDYATGSVTTSHNNTNRYVVYQEGVYLGYRYAETRYEDVVLETESAGDFNYSAAISYPFGYGKSYTAFSYSNYKATKNGSKYRVAVDVKNTGTVEGKEVVQIYLQKPYRDYDKQHGIEKPSVELVEFTKTKMLAAGEQVTVTVDVDEKYFASYDANGAKTYVVTAGDYYLAAGYNSHDALNNILAAKGKSPSNTAGRMDAAGNAALAKAFTMSFDETSYSESDATGNAITNLFDFADINRYEGKGSNSVTYMTRSNWQGTVKLGLSNTNTKLDNNVRLTKTQRMTDDQRNIVEKDDIEYPAYEVDRESITLVSMRTDDNAKKIPFDDPKWDKFMDQLSWNETVSLLRTGLRKTVVIASVVKPETIDHNGPSGLNQNDNPKSKYANNAAVGNSLGLAVNTNDPLKDTAPMCYPCNGIIASTFNKALAEKIGEMFGEEALWSGYSGLYGTGVNIHRSAYQGRAFEYYSEDPILTGVIAAYWTKGVQAHGCYVYNKHLFVNEQEYNRNGICTWANEQSLREIYLRAFEIPITLGGAQNVMTGLNRIGAVWCGASKALMTDYLRGECGMEGFAISDWWDGNYMELGSAILAGSDLPDGDCLESELSKYKNGYGKLANAMRLSAKRILYTVAHSNAMNGYATGTKIIQLTPEWVTAVIAVDITLGALFALSIAWLVIVLILQRKSKAKVTSVNAKT